MKVSTSVIISALMMLLQFLAQVTETLPADAKFWAMVAQIVLEAVKSLLVHFSNPDGTSAAAPWIKGGVK